MRTAVIVGLAMVASSGCDSVLQETGCERFVDHLRSLDCAGPEVIRLFEDCPPTNVSCDPFYDCLVSGTTCGPDFVLAGPEECGDELLACPDGFFGGNFAPLKLGW